MVGLFFAFLGRSPLTIWMMIGTIARKASAAWRRGSLGRRPPPLLPFLPPVRIWPPLAPGRKPSLKGLTALETARFSKFWDWCASVIFM